MPMKALPAAKSRLRAGTTPAVHTALVEAMRADVLSAARATPQVSRIIAVADDGTDYGVDHTIRQRRRGLNGALRDGAEFAMGRWPDDGVAALVGDLPSLRPEELGAALDAAAAHRFAFVHDAEGSGTTLLTAAPDQRMRPRFGAGSAARHARIAVSLPDVGPGLRHDVDTAADLAAAAALGVGERTGAALHAVPRSP